MHALDFFWGVFFLGGGEGVCHSLSFGGHDGLWVGFQPSFPGCFFDFWEDGFVDVEGVVVFEDDADVGDFAVGLAGDEGAAMSVVDDGAFGGGCDGE